MPAHPAIWNRLLGRLSSLFATGLLLVAGVAGAEEGVPGRVGRLADFSGGVSMYDQEQGVWAPAMRNRPLTSGDRLSTQRDGSAELRIGSTTLRLGAAGELEVVRLDDDRLRFRLHAGTVALRVRSREVAAELEIETAEARLQPLRGGHFRIDRQDDTTFAASWRGELRVAEGRESFEIDTGRRVELWREGPGRSLRHAWTSTPDDAFAEWALREDRLDDRSAAARYVSPETTGFEDLDRHGRWDNHPEYGAIWYPLAVADDWAPYRFGHWAWVRPWGWTWVDDARWGFAPFHYGRWVNWRQRWCWVPGPIMARPVYSPALVAWVGGPRFGVSISVGGPTLGWVPLAPREGYRPSYKVAPRHRDHYAPPPGPGQAPVGPVMYTNQGVPGGITVVPASVLEQHRQPVPVVRHELRDDAVVREYRRRPLTPTQPLVQPPVAIGREAMPAPPPALSPALSPAPSPAAAPVARPAPIPVAPEARFPGIPADRTAVEPVPRRSRPDAEAAAPRGRVPSDARPQRPQPSERPAVQAPQAPQAPIAPPASPAPPTAAIAPPPARAATPPSPPQPMMVPVPAKPEAARTPPAPPKEKAPAPAPEEGRGKLPNRERQQLN